MIRIDPAAVAGAGGAGRSFALPAGARPTETTQPSDPDALLRNSWSSSAYTGFVPETKWTGYAPAVEFLAY
jgi:hypothetical protein